MATAPAERGSVRTTPCDEGKICIGCMHRHAQTGERCRGRRQQRKGTWPGGVHRRRGYMLSVRAPHQRGRKGGRCALRWSVHGACISGHGLYHFLTPAHSQPFSTFFLRPLLPPAATHHTSRDSPHPALLLQHSQLYTPLLQLSSKPPYHWLVEDTPSPSLTTGPHAPSPAFLLTSRLQPQLLPRSTRHSTPHLFKPTL